MINNLTKHHLYLDLIVIRVTELLLFSKHNYMSFSLKMFYTICLSPIVAFFTSNSFILISRLRSQLYTDLDKKQTDYKKLIEKSSKEAEKKTLKLKNRVDKVEKKLIKVSLLLSLAFNLAII